MSEPVFLYDGDCAFCTSCARFIRRHIPTRAEVVPWQQADLGALGVTRQRAENAVQWVAAGTAEGAAAGPEAIARLLVDAGSFWRPVGRLLGTRPVLRVAWPVYAWVARNRHRMPGGTPACSLPPAARGQAQRTPHGCRRRRRPALPARPRPPQSPGPLPFSAPPQGAGLRPLCNPDDDPTGASSGE